MKTKVLLSTMVLAAALAGCSQDEWGVNNANTSNLDNRRSVGNVVLSLTDLSTRMEETEDGSIVYSADDKVGAHLMDEFGGTYPIGNLVNYAQSNHPFQQDGDDWKTTGVLLEGNYFFTYPFNACQQDRNAVINTVPVDQYAYDRETGEFNPKQSYIDNQFYVGYKYLHADDDCVDCDEVGSLTAHVNMEKVHAYPIFKFSMEVGNPSDKPLKIYKISLRNGEEGNYEMFYNTVAVFPQAKDFQADPNADKVNEEGKYDLWKTAVYNRNIPGQPDSAEPFDAREVCNSKTLEYNLLFPEGGMEVNNWDEFEVWMTVPAGVYKDLQLLLYTDKGVGIYDIDKPNDNKDSEVQNGTRTLTPKRQNILVRVQSGSLSMNKWRFTVQSTENLIEYLKYVAEVGTEETARVTTVGDEVELSQEVYDILKNHNLKLDLNGTLVIPAGVPNDAIDRINYYHNGARVINLGEQVIKETPMKNLRVGRNVANVRIENFGTLTLQANMPMSMIVNAGTLNVEESSVYALLNMTSGTTNVSKQLNVIQLLNLGTMNVAKEAEVNVLSKWFNFGETVNEGKITTYPADWSNPGFIGDFDIIDWEKDYHFNGWWNGHALYDREITAKVYKAFIATSAEAVNFGTIDNKVSGIINSTGLITRENETNFVTLINGKLSNYFWIFFDDLKIETTKEWAAVTSLLNYTNFDLEIGINNSGRITNLSNFGMLTPQVGSRTSLVEMKAETLEQISETLEAAKLYLQYLQGDVEFWKKGYINMTPNDGKKGGDQALITRNDDTQGEEYKPINQIVFVKRTNESKVANLFYRDVKDEEGDAARYINTIWLDGAKATMPRDTQGNAMAVDLTETGKAVDLWMSGGSSIMTEKDADLTLGGAYLTDVATFSGMGKVKLTENIYVKEGVLEIDAYFTADELCKVIGTNRNEVKVSVTPNDNVKIDYMSFDYIGPWIIIE